MLAALFQARIAGCAVAADLVGLDGGCVLNEQGVNLVGLVPNETAQAPSLCMAGRGLRLAAAICSSCLPRK